MLSPTKKARLLECIQELYEVIEAQKTDTPCIDCTHFGGKRCVKWDTEIPVEIRPVGCEAWEFVGYVPF